VVDWPEEEGGTEQPQKAKPGNATAAKKATRSQAQRSKGMFTASSYLLLDLLGGPLGLKFR
jgi:hypothetical protein